MVGFESNFSMGTERLAFIMAPFDNINKPVSTIRETSVSIYRELEKKNRSAFLDLGLIVFMEAYEEAKPGEKPSKSAAQDKINEKWLDSLQTEYNPVTKYVYSREVERKRARFFESTVADVEVQGLQEVQYGMEEFYRRRNSGIEEQ